MSIAAAKPTGGVSFRDDGVIATGTNVPILVTLSDTGSLVGEELRLLAAKVYEIQRQRGSKCFGVTSPMPGEGKSTITVGLTGALAREAGRQVLLVECDLRRPSLARTLRLPAAPGLGEWLDGHLDQLPVRRVDPGGFSLLVAGQAELQRPELLGSPRMQAALQAARDSYDFVVLDAPPILPVTDAVLLQDLLDGFLLVARSRLTPREALNEAIAKLRADKILGVLLNDHREYRDSYRARAYSRYGME
jgi:capsular exopolysaccharide synthesis family protein